MASFTPQEIEQFLQQFFDVVGTRQYIGARYVPIFGRKGEDTIEWDKLAPYEPLTVVMHQGVSYVSKQYVPKDVEITDTNYWAETYRFNAQVEQYRQEVLTFQSQIDEITEDYVPFPDSDVYPKYGNSGQVLTTLSDGTTKWENPVVPSDEQAEEIIDAWLVAHPEATTTVLDNSITSAKLQDNSVTNTKLANNSVTNDKITNNSITDAKLVEENGVLEVVATLIDKKQNIFSNGVFEVPFTTNPGYIQNAGGIHSPDATKQEVYTNYFEFHRGNELQLKLNNPNPVTIWLAVAVYDSDKNILVRNVLSNTVLQDAYYEVAYSTNLANAYYVRVSYATYGTIKCAAFLTIPFISETNIKLDVVYENVNLVNGMTPQFISSVTYENIEDTIKITSVGGERYSSIQYTINVQQYDAITINADSVNNLQGRFGYKDTEASSATNWVSSIDEYPKTFAVSDYDYIVIGFYVPSITGTPTDGEYGTIERLRVSAGDTADIYPGPTANDEYARNEIESLKESVIETGNYSYWGNKVQFSVKDSQHKCDYNIWKEFKIADIPSLGDYDLRLNQSIAIHDDKVFLFKSDNTCVIMDYLTKEFIGIASVPNASHANSAQFTSIYYDSNDEFPLVLISKCGNSNTPSGQTSGSDDAALFYRITRDNTTYTFTLIQTTILDVGSYGSSWCLDEYNNMLYCAYFKNGNWSVNTDNPLYIAVFKAPSSSDILSGTTITFTENDAVSDYEGSFEIFQGCFAINGLLYLGLQDSVDGSSVWVYDVFGKEIKTKIKMQSTKEVEGVCLYDNTMFVSQRSGADTENIYPLIVNSYGF